MSKPETIGTFAHPDGYTAVGILPAGAQTLVVDTSSADPDDPRVLCTTTQRGEAEAYAAAHVLACAGRLGCEPEQLAESPVTGPARDRLALKAGNAAPVEVTGRDGPVPAGQARRMFAAELGRYVHVPNPTSARWQRPRGYRDGRHTPPT